MMKKLILIVAIVMALMLSGCVTMENWTEKEKRTAYIVGAVVTVGVVAIAAGEYKTGYDNRGETCVQFPVPCT